jgi:spore coat protein SA
VASAVGGILDIVTDGVNGFLVEPRSSQALGDRIVEIVKNDDLQREMGRKGREFVDEHFSWQAKAREILEIYEKIIT